MIDEGARRAADLDQWDTYWQVVYDDAVADGETPNAAVRMADRKTTEKFGPRPEEQG